MCAGDGEIEEGWAGSWYLAVSEYLRFSPAEESGRYLIVIASMERTEAVPVRKFLIYLVFLFSLSSFSPSPPSRELVICVCVCVCGGDI